MSNKLIFHVLQPGVPHQDTHPTSLKVPKWICSSYTLQMCYTDPAFSMFFLMTVDMLDMYILSFKCSTAQSHSKKGLLKRKSADHTACQQSKQDHRSSPCTSIQKLFWGEPFSPRCTATPHLPNPTFNPRSEQTAEGLEHVTHTLLIHGLLIATSGCLVFIFFT